MSNKIVHKAGPRHRFKDQLFWAEGGFICVEDQNDGDFKALTRAEAAARAIALNAELKLMTYPSERNELSSCVVALCEAVKEAKRQGDPTDPTIARQKAKEFRKVSVLTDYSTPVNSSTKAYTYDKAESPVGTGTLIGLASDRFAKLKL